ncbi:MAG TPA: hypothetical protein VHW00_23455 [Thermoanaerobaculia bacterium]|nr:hypothetical protein [Thermoanaerobaculia bacterium]
MPGFLLALLLTAFPSSQQTAWMRLESFRLAIGMSRMQTLETLKAWNPKEGKDRNELVVDYTGEKSITLEFRNERLHSVRFELFVVLPQARVAFEEERQHLLDAIGKPRKATPSVLIYDGQLPNLMVVVQDDPKSEQGKKGVGVLAVRYYDPR